MRGQRMTPERTPEATPEGAEHAERVQREKVRRMISERRAFKLALQRVTFRTHGKRTV